MVSIVSTHVIILQLDYTLLEHMDCVSYKSVYHHSACQIFNKYLVVCEGRIQFKSKVRLLLRYAKLLLKKGTKTQAWEKHQLHNRSMGSSGTLPRDRE